MISVLPHADAVASSNANSSTEGVVASSIIKIHFMLSFEGGSGPKRSMAKLRNIDSALSSWFQVCYFISLTLGAIFDVFKMRKELNKDV